jgi:ABC-type sugar transport system permease subunit
VPWAAGIVGIGYNPTLTGREITTFDDLLDPAFAGRRHVPRDARHDVPGPAVARRGPEEATVEDAQRAQAKLLEAAQRGQFRAFYGNDYYDQLAAGNLALTMAWSGDVSQMKLYDNEDVEFVIPDSGGMLYVDNMVIPGTRRARSMRTMMMDFWYELDNAAALIEYIGFFSPVEGVPERVLEHAAAARAEGDDEWADALEVIAGTSVPDPDTQLEAAPLPDPRRTGGAGVERPVQRARRRLTGRAGDCARSVSVSRRLRTSRHTSSCCPAGCGWRSSSSCRWRSCCGQPAGGHARHRISLTWNFGVYSEVVWDWRDQFLRSIVYALIVTGLTLLIGYPIAYTIAFRGGRFKNILLLLVILPFFTAFIIRTLAWKLILADNGFVLGTLKELGPAGAQLPRAGDAAGSHQRPDLQLPAVHGAAAVRRPREDRSEADRGGGRPLRQPPAGVPARDAAAVDAGVFAGSLLVFIPSVGDFINADPGQPRHDDDRQRHPAPVPQHQCLPRGVRPWLRADGRRAGAGRALRARSGQRGADRG